MVSDRQFRDLIQHHDRQAQQPEQQIPDGWDSSDRLNATIAEGGMVGGVAHSRSMGWQRSHLVPVALSAVTASPGTPRDARPA